MPQPTRDQLRRLRNSQKRLAKARQELNELEQSVTSQEDEVFNWLEELQVDSATIHQQQIVITTTPAKVDWQRAFRDQVGDDAADDLVRRVEQHLTPGVTIHVFGKSQDEIR